MSDELMQDSKLQNEEEKKQNNYKKNQNRKNNQNRQKKNDQINQNKKKFDDQSNIRQDRNNKTDIKSNSDKEQGKNVPVQTEAIPILGLERHGIHISPGNLVTGLTLIGNILLAIGTILPFVRFTVAGNVQTSTMFTISGTNVHGIALIVMAFLSIILTVAKHRNTSAILNIISAMYIAFFSCDVIKLAGHLMGEKNSRVAIGFEFLSGFVVLVVGCAILIATDIYLIHNEFFDNDIDEGIDDIVLKGSRGLNFILDLICYIVVSLCVLSSISALF